jgi:hypothetical protein
VAATQGRLRATPAFELRQDEFDVLARAQLVSGEIAATAAVQPCRSAADANPVATTGFRIAHPKIGKKRFFAEIFHGKRLRATELPTQADLPLRHIEVIGGVQSRQDGLGLLRACLALAASGGHRRPAEWGKRG